MTLYEIVNPSDPYTLAADDFETACLANILLSEGLYGLDEIDGNGRMPILGFGGADAADRWWRERFGRSLDDALAAMDRAAVATCLGSVLIGSAKDRKAYEAGLELIDDPAKRKAWHDRWHDDRRSSVNNIGKRAWQLGEQLHLVRREVVRDDR